MNKLQELLRSPPRKEANCPKCGGDGIVNLRGMISSDPCPRCSIDRWHSSGKVMVIDYKEFEKQVREVIKAHKDEV